MTDYHSFNTEYATKFGVNESIIMRHFVYWTECNAMNEKNFHDGRYWSYSSVKALSELFPYFSEKTIRNTIERLISLGHVVKGNYNKVAFDRTSWYSVTDDGMAEYGKSICRNGEMHLPSRANGIAVEGEPIPYTEPNKETDIEKESVINNTREKRFSKPTIDEVKAYIESQGYNVDPENFIDFYESNGWKVGRNPMKDWKATVRTWNRNAKGRGREKEKECHADYTGTLEFDTIEVNL